MRPLARWRRIGLSLVGLAGWAGLGGCGGDAGDTSAVCAPSQQLLEQGGIHVLAGVEVSYEYSPPTSGPHQLPAPAPGIASAPVAEPLQVSALEAGMVLVQFGPEISPADQASLGRLAALDGVLIAPAASPIDDDAAIALTAWGVRQLCSAVDLEAAEAFIDRWAGVVFVNHNG